MATLLYSFHHKREFAYILVFLYGHLFIRSCREHMNERTELTNLIYVNIIKLYSQYISMYYFVRITVIVNVSLYILINL